MVSVFGCRLLVVAVGCRRMNLRVACVTESFTVGMYITGLGHVVHYRVHSFFPSLLSWFCSVVTSLLSRACNLHKYIITLWLITLCYKKWYALGLVFWRTPIPTAAHTHHRRQHDGGHFQEVTSFPSPHQSLLADTTSKAMQSKRYLSRGQRCCVCKKQKKLDC